MIEAKAYKTKTYFMKRKNACTEKQWIIALDAGYSGVKIMSPNVVACFPSIAKRLDDRGFIGRLPDECIRLTDHLTHETWLVGQHAQDTLSDEDTSVSARAIYNRNRYENPMFKVLVEAGLGIACMKNAFGDPAGKTLYVQTGLPLEYMEDGTAGAESSSDTDAEMLRSVISGRHSFSLCIGSDKEVRFDFVINPKHVYTLSQPRGTLFSVAINNDGNVKPGASELFGKKGLVFDAGFGTLDIFSLKANKTDGGQTWPDLGMKAVMERTAEGIRKRDGVKIPVPAMQKYLETGKIRYHKGRISKHIDFSDILEESSKAVCNEAIDRLFTAFPVYEYDYLIITGGTGDAWKEQIREELAGMETLEIMNGDANDTLPMIFANVRGFYMYALLRLENGKI